MVSEDVLKGADFKLGFERWVQLGQSGKKPYRKKGRVNGPNDNIWGRSLCPRNCAEHFINDL